MTKSSGGAMIVVTADQIRSSSRGDRVPAMLTALESLTLGGRSRAFARTAGDEVQALIADPADAVSAVRLFVREGGWRVGLGIGPVDTPVPDDVRAANGPAFVAARAAVNESRGGAQDLAVVTRVGGAEASAAADDARAALDLLAFVWRRRTAAGWEVADLVAEGLSRQEIAARLGVTGSAVSQRVSTAAVVEADAGEALAVRALTAALG
ncbi:SatD family protein [Dermacoccus barathri]